MGAVVLPNGSVKYTDPWTGAYRIVSPSGRIVEQNYADPYALSAGIQISENPSVARNVQQFNKALHSGGVYTTPGGEVLDFGQYYSPSTPSSGLIPVPVSSPTSPSAHVSSGTLAPLPIQELTPPRPQEGPPETVSRTSFVPSRPPTPLSTQVYEGGSVGGGVGLGGGVAAVRTSSSRGNAMKQSLVSPILRRRQKVISSSSGGESGGPA